MTGTVADLFRYPVKSMLGEAVEATTIDAYGLAGDRTFAVVDTGTGRVASAKRPRLWRDLLTVTARRVGDRVVLTLPDGREVTAGVPDADAAVSDLLGRPVRLTSTAPADATIERAVPEQVVAEGPAADVAVTLGRLGSAAPAGTFFDFAPVHLITTATLAAIAALSARGHLETVRFRPGVVLDMPAAAGFAENNWSDRLLQVGDAVLRVIAATPRCAVPTLAHGAAPADPDVLRLLARHNRVDIPGLGPTASAGAYAEVVTPGAVRRGAVATLR